MKSLIMFLFVGFLATALPSESQAQRHGMMGDADCTTIGKVRDRWAFDIRKVSEVGNEIRWSGGIRKTVRALNKNGQVVNVPLRMEATIIGNPAFTFGTRIHDQMSKVTITLKALNPDLGSVETAVLEGSAGTYYTYALRADRLRTKAELSGQTHEAATMLQREQFVEGARHNLEIFCNFNTGPER